MGNRGLTGEQFTEIYERNINIPPMDTDENFGFVAAFMLVGTIELGDRSKAYLSLINNLPDQMPDGTLFSALPVTVVGGHSLRKGALTKVVTKFDEAESPTKNHTLTIVNSSGLIIESWKYALRFKPDKGQPRKLYGILAGFFVTLESLEDIGKSLS